MEPTKEQKAEHTPGPWEVRDRWYISRPGKMALAEVKCGDVPFEATEIHEANARLIAAAPDLLAACKEFVRKCDSGEARSSHSYAQMVAAITKAGAQ
jgi:hypothetical protein